MPHDRGPDRIAAPARPAARAWSPPTWRQLWFQVHWLIGITAGSVLVVIGLSGAVLSFRDEILDAIDPGVRTVAVRPGPTLTPQQVIDAVGQAKPGERVAQVTMLATPGAAVRVALAPPAGQRRGQTVYVDPYDGTLRPALRGAAFFEWTESLHRWLLLPRDSGKLVGGALALCLLGMALSGLYLRWPRRPREWRQWLTFDPKRKGRPFLWGLHAVVGTVVLVIYLVSTTTGVYWAFDVVRATVDGWAGVARVERAAGGRGRPAADGPARAVDLSAAWAAFAARAGDWRLVQVRVPERAGQGVQFSWLAGDAPHERARSRMTVAAGGAVTQDLRYAALSVGERALSTIYPLHMGSYFGLAGRIATMVAALALALFAVTGWMMYLGRRRLKRAAGVERKRWRALPPTVVAYRDQQDPVLVVFATQTGHAERLALQSAGVLQRGGLAVTVQSLARLEPGELARHTRVLVVASSFGEGDPPDGVRRFVRLLDDGGPLPYAGLRYGLLALGDRHYPKFCGFGHALDDRLQAHGAEPLFSLVEVDGDDPDALARWSAQLAALGGDATVAVERQAGLQAAPYQRWTLAGRELLNPGSVGAPLYEVTLTGSPSVAWRPGALVELLPRQSSAAIDRVLAWSGLHGSAPVVHDGATRTLAEALGRSERPADDGGGRSAQALADRLVPLLPRRYSIASLPEDGVLQLLVRQERHAWGVGVASGWLTEAAPPGSAVDLRLVDNPGFAAADDDGPCLYVGNGSGLAGLRGHLRARVRSGRHRNWLVFGERQRLHDRPCAAELDRWVADGHLARLDLAYSRDGDALRYVQDHLRAADAEVRAWIDAGAVVFVCGSLQGMAAGVDDALAGILGRDRLEDLIAAGRYRRDVY